MYRKKIDKIIKVRTDIYSKGIGEDLHDVEQQIVK